MTRPKTITDHGEVFKVTIDRWTSTDRKTEAEYFSRVGPAKDWIFEEFPEVLTDDWEEKPNSFLSTNNEYLITTYHLTDYQPRRVKGGVNRFLQISREMMENELPYRISISMIELLG